MKKGTTVASVPSSFDAEAYAGRWFRWEDINRTYGPGASRRAAGWNPMLEPIGYHGGVYCLAQSSRVPRRVGPKAPEVKHIGEAASFRETLRQFGCSAGFWGKRVKLHPVGVKWPEGESADLWVSLHPVGYGLTPHLAGGLRCWMEALALDQFRQLHGEFPKFNRRERRPRDVFRPTKKIDYPPTNVTFKDAPMAKGRVTKTEMGL